MPARARQRELNAVYARFNRRCYVHPDPLEFLYAYPDPRDREIVALVASCLAYGRVSQILRSVARVLDLMSPSPARFIRHMSNNDLKNAFSAFKHRFTTGEHLAALLHGTKCAIVRHGSLCECFLAGLGPDDETVVPALCRFVDELGLPQTEAAFGLVPSPKRGSACKRLNLFLRWMVRRDAVDPGGWHGVSPSQLLVPLDTHMHRISRALNLTRRRQADLKTCLEITGAFRAIAPEDPVRYDFSLTRWGIREEADVLGLLNLSAGCEVA